MTAAVAKVNAWAWRTVNYKRRSCDGFRRIAESGQVKSTAASFPTAIERAAVWIGILLIWGAERQQEGKIELAAPRKGGVSLGRTDRNGWTTTKESSTDLMAAESGLRLIIIKLCDTFAAAGGVGSSKYYVELQNEPLKSACLFCDLRSIF